MRVTFLAALSLAAQLAHAQTPIEPNASRIELQVFDTTANAWTSTTTVTPNARIEWRVRVSYTGTNSNVLALSSIRYQPTFSNIDNDNTIGTRDDLAAWRRPNTFLGTTDILSQEEGEIGGPLPGYGRVAFIGVAMSSTSLNALTMFRHGGGAPQNAAPAGSWLRIAGSGAPSWPLATVTAASATVANLSNIARGVVASQASEINPITGSTNPFYLAGTQNLVVFRGALLLSDLQDPRTLALSIAPGSQDRAGTNNSPDDARFMTWFTSQTGSSIRTQVAFTDASIVVVPSPTALTSFSLLLLAAARRRRP
ncbi:hypothetical protein LBMAG48_17170 [Phycisphaerae bacterium]|nr:hypothetical protein LBMAG48_17170 [Phycisphaerae bacterium]